jgi:hypothetical protein
MSVRPVSGSGDPRPRAEMTAVVALIEEMSDAIAALYRAWLSDAPTDEIRTLWERHDLAELELRCIIQPFELG